MIKDFIVPKFGFEFKKGEIVHLEDGAYGYHKISNQGKAQFFWTDKPHDFVKVKL